MSLRPVSVECKVPPLAEVCTLAEAKAQLRVVGIEEDAYISALIPFAREFVEARTNRSLAPQTWRAEYEAANCQGAPVFPTSLRIPRPPFIGSAVLKFRDADGVEFDADASSFFIGRDVTGAEMLFRAIPSGASLAHPRPIAVEWQSGDAVVNHRCKQAVLLMISNMFENRTPVNAGTNSAELPLSLTAVLDSLRVRMIG